MHEKKAAKGVKTKENIIMELHIDPQEPDLTFSGNRAFNTDCMEAMRQMPDKCFDLATVPYFQKSNHMGGQLFCSSAHAVHFGLG